MFDDCLELTGNESCGFVEDPKDSLDWIIGSGEFCSNVNEKDIIFIVPEETTGQNVNREGKYLWIEKSENFQTSIARISSPTYQNSRSDCTLRFSYYISGNLGNYFIKPALHPVGAEKDIMLDFLSADDEWKTKTITIGRRRGAFQVILNTQTNFSL